MEENPEGVHVGGGRDCLATYCWGLRSRGSWREGRSTSLGRRAGVRTEELGDPEIQELRHPSPVTRMLLAFRSRCTTRCRCASATAAHTSRNSGRRWRLQVLLYDEAIDGVPSTHSITKYGAPSSVDPPSISRAMFGWSRLARSAARAKALADEGGAEPLERTTLIATCLRYCRRRARRDTRRPFRHGRSRARPHTRRSSSRNIASG